MSLISVNIIGEYVLIDKDFFFPVVISDPKLDIISRTPDPLFEKLSSRKIEKKNFVEYIIDFPSLSSVDLTQYPDDFINMLKDAIYQTYTSYPYFAPIRDLEMAKVILDTMDRERFSSLFHGLVVTSYVKGYKYSLYLYYNKDVEAVVINVHDLSDREKVEKLKELATNTNSVVDPSLKLFIFLNLTKKDYTRLYMFLRSLELNQKKYNVNLVVSTK